LGLPVRALLGLALLVGRDTVRGDHVHALIDEATVEHGDLLLRQLHLLQGGGDLLEREIATFGAPRNQALQFLTLDEGLLVGCDGLTNRRQLLSFLPGDPGSASPLPLRRGPALKRWRSIWRRPPGK